MLCTSARIGTNLRKCHSEAYGGHHAGDRTTHKVLQSGFYWPTLFKDARKFVLSCDECQRIGNIGKCQEMPMNYSLVVEPFDVWGFDYMGPFPSSNGYTHILVVVDYVIDTSPTYLQFFIVPCYYIIHLGCFICIYMLFHMIFGTNLLT